MRQMAGRFSHLLLFAALCIVGVGAAVAAPPIAKENALIDASATGSFEVKLTPNSAPDAPVGGMAISKTFHGGLEGESVGQMLAVRTPTDGSAGYVAMERVTATLAGKHGTFALQHSGSMNKGAPSLSVTVVPDSGSEGLVGLSGSMEIKVEGGRHLYVFRYSLPG